MNFMKGRRPNWTRRDFFRIAGAGVVVALLFRETLAVARWRFR
jgi:hypothetical protein